MKRSRFSESQIVAILKEAEAGVSLEELSRQHGFSKATYYKWKAQYGGMDVSALKRLKELEEENRRLKQMYAELSLDHKSPQGDCRKKAVAPEQRRELAEQVRLEHRMSERRACRVLDLSRTTCRYQARKTEEAQIEQALRQLAEQHRRWGYGKMVDYLKNQGTAGTTSGFIGCIAISLNLRRNRRNGCPPEPPKSGSACPGRTRVGRWTS